MDLSQYHEKYVRIKDIYGEVHEGLACHGGADFLMAEYGGEEDGLFIEDFLIYESQIETIEEYVPHGTAEIWTEQLKLRRFRLEDAKDMYWYFGRVPSMYKYSGWNPYATPEIAEETIRGFIDHYGDEHFYSWVMDVDDVLVGTIGAYDYKDGQIEVGYSVIPGWQGRGFATEALVKILNYLTENEGIPCVTAWCAAENAASVRVLEKAGMKLVRTEKGGLVVGGKVYDKMYWEFKGKNLGRRD